MTQNLNHLQIGLPARPRRRGFTIIEVMVTVAIILILVAILVVALGEAKKSVRKQASAAAISALSTAIESYYQDVGAYPDSTNRTFVAASTAGTLPTPYTSTFTLDSGASALAEGLMGYLPYAYDGAGSDTSNNSNAKSTDSAYGFRLRTGGYGKVYGPYMTVKVVSNTAPIGTANYLANSTTGNQYFIDPYGNTILYFRSSLVGSPSTATIAAATAVFSTSTTGSLFNLNDNSPFTTTSPSITSGFYSLIGSSNNTANGTITGHDSYLLVGGDENGVYFDDNNVVNSR